MNCSKCQSLRISIIIQIQQKVDCPDHSKIQVKPKQKQCLNTNPPNAIDRWLWSHGFQAMSGADAVDAMESEE